MVIGAHGVKYDVRVMYFASHNQYSKPAHKELQYLKDATYS